jgi:signal peptidase II
VRVAIIALIILGCVGCDQVTKSVARGYLPHDRTVSLLADTLRLQYTENAGAFLSIGQDLPRAARRALFTWGGALLVAGVLLWTLRGRHAMAQTVAGAMICGGGLGNLIDRWVRAGDVTDFLNVGIGALRTGIFNVADMVMMLGAALLIVASATAAARPAPRGE